MLGRMFVCHDEDDTAGDVCRPMRQIKMSTCQAFIEPQFRFRGWLPWRKTWLKHAFFALEACRVGGVILTLGDPPPPNPNGYLFGTTVEKHIRQFLTAGDERQDVPPGIFTALLLGAFEHARTTDGYVYTSDVIAYVTHEAPRYTVIILLAPNTVRFRLQEEAIWSLGL
jgi:hypothetical protein